MKKLIILDLDGTILDSISDLVCCGNKIRSDYHLPPFSQDIIKTFIGNGVENFVKKLFSDTDAVPLNALSDFKAYYKDHIADFTRPFPGIRQFLIKAKEKSICTVVLSNKNEALSRHVLEKVKLSAYFNFIFGGDSFAQKKPSPAGILEIMRMTDTKPDQTLMVGDSPNDILAGKESAVSTAAALYGYSPLESLTSLNPDILLPTSSALNQLL